MELSQKTKDQLRELKNQYSDILENWSKSGGEFEKAIAMVVCEGSK